MKKLILHTFLGGGNYYTRIWKMSIIKNEVFKTEVHSTRLREMYVTHQF